MVECMFCKHKVIGSNPIVSIKIKLQKNSLQVGFEPTTWWLTATCS